MVELAPAYGLDDKVRQALHADALKIARHVKYRNAGTVEFMVDKNGDYYFLEVNPRIQVVRLLHMWYVTAQGSEPYLAAHRWSPAHDKAW